ERGQPEGIETRHFTGDVAHHRCRAAALAKHRKPEAAHPAQAVSDVQFIVLLELRPLALGQDFAQQMFDRCRLEWLLIDRSHGAIDLDLHGRSGRQKKVRGLFLAHQGQQAIHGHG
ncbi:MAG: hypothetical protein ACK559_05785, partial [bacterium]